MIVIIIQLFLLQVVFIQKWTGTALQLMQELLGIRLEYQRFAACKQPQFWPEDTE
ncbi:hypothetical protein NI467_12200 [Acinetobacter bohemicus]|uniref:hypothetical protein n=1 Tax=Acinetobacter sp. S4397-1 TaxID=2972915 RepID=UPI00209B384E|nr:hypothetical protein [Acinetobacter sp. S4397-1]MCO8046091.1 hypothetical protein [Acinetobacter sp. S4397-1]